MQVLISGSSTTDHVKNPPIPALKKDISLWRSKWRNGTSFQILVKFKFVCFSIFGLDNLPIRTSRFWGNPDLVDSFWIAEAQHSLCFGEESLQQIEKGFLMRQALTLQAKDTYHSYAKRIHTVDGRNPATVEVGSLSHYLQGFFYIPGGAGFLFHQQYFPNHLMEGLYHFPGRYLVPSFSMKGKSSWESMFFLTLK